MARVTVLIAAEARERALCRSLLTREAGIALVGETRPDPAPATLARRRSRILLLDLTRPRLDRLAALARVRRQSPRARVILLTTRRTPEALILEALTLGARGYLDRAALRTFLPKAVRAVDAGEAWVPRRMVSKILDRLVWLSAAERQVPGVARG